ncbi:MAG: hypothetical protein ACI9SP_003262 [Arenicella sp.]|jgi:hypothetical protein
MPNIQYHGDNRTTESCIDAIARLLHFGDRIGLALLLTCEGHHAFLLTLNEYQKIIIQSGFASGYGGEGPKGLSKVIQLLRLHSVELEEVYVSSKIFSRIESSQLRDKDLQQIEETSYVRPITLIDYVFDIGEIPERELLMRFPCVIPWATLDPRIIDLVLILNLGDSSAVSRAFNRFETILKERAGNNSRSLRAAANSVFSNGCTSDSPSAAEKLVTSVYTLFRNSRAHEERYFSREEDIRCIALINELFLLEDKEGSDSGR